jgi:hypothetical protein
VVPIITAENKVELLQVEYVESVPANWVLSMPFNVLDYYTLTKGGNYSVKAKFNVRAYLPDSVSQTDPKYGQHDSGSSGDIESNIISFALSAMASQTITFNPLSNKTYGDPSFAVSATASSGLPVSFSVFSGPATISGSTVTITGVGTVTIRASQSGNANWNPAPNVDQSFQVFYAFTGFFSPVDKLPTFNVVKAGQAVPVKFSLRGNQGLNIFATGYPTSLTIQCTDNTGLYDAIEETVTAGGSSLSYDAASDRYTYVWKTDKAWPANTCRQFVIKFVDGSYERANFQFKK